MGSQWPLGEGEGEGEGDGGTCRVATRIAVLRSSACPPSPFCKMECTVRWGFALL